MESRLDKVHISYKHDDEYKEALGAIRAGLEKSGIPYSIDTYDILYRDSIDEYEKEIGKADRVIMFVIPNYFRSLDCMFEMTQMFMCGNIRERVFPVVDMGGIPRNGNGLTEVKEYWQQEKVRKLGIAQREAGGSSYLLMEIQRIDDIITTLDEFWLFISRHSTGNFEQLVENDAALLMEELKRSLPLGASRGNGTEQESNPTPQNTPLAREVNQSGDKAIYIETNTGTITIN